MGGVSLTVLANYFCDISVNETPRENETWEVSLALLAGQSQQMTSRCPQLSVFLYS